LPKVFTYQKKDKLKSRKQMQFLFSNGHAITNFPVRLIYTVQAQSTSPEGILNVGVGAPSRTFRKAVARNRVKRLLRESYRLEKPGFEKLIQIAHKQVAVFFLYTDANVLTQKEIQAKVQLLLAKLAVKINATNLSNEVAS
jgi:ribonuclease P protein component